MVQLIEKGEYTNLEFNQVQPNETIEFTLLFDEPIEKDGKFGPYQIYKVTMHGEHEGKEVSFIPKNSSPSFGKKMGEYLKQYSAGSRLKLTKRLGTSKKGTPFFYWDVDAVGQQQNSSPQKSSPSGSQNPMVGFLVNASNGQKQEKAWVVQQLNSAGLTDAVAVDNVWNEYDKAW